MCGVESKMLPHITFRLFGVIIIHSVWLFCELKERE